MSALQESRRELMVQLEGLMKLLKVSRVSSQGCLAGSGTGGAENLFLSSHEPRNLPAIKSGVHRGQRGSVIGGGGGAGIVRLCILLFKRTCS